MKTLRLIQYLSFVLLVCIENNYGQDFKIAPNTPLPEGSNFYNVSIASDTSSGFLVTWMSQRWVENIVYNHNFACRVSKTGEMLDSTAIFLCSPVWTNYCPSAVFAGGNWIIAGNQGWLDEYIGVQRLTPSGTLLDNEPVNVLPSTGGATIIDPILATNGREILCIAGVAADSLFASIFDPDLHILVDRFGLFPKTGTSTRCYRAISDGENFYVTFSSSNLEDQGNKLIVINPNGKILSVQTEWGWFPTITETDNTIHYTSFRTNITTKLYLRRYNPEGIPIDPDPFIISEFQDFGPIVEKMYQSRYGYVDIVSTDKSFFLFWPRVASHGMSMIHFQSDFLASGIDALNSQCQIIFELPHSHYTSSFSLIRASSIGNNVLTAWIDGREGDTRVYGNFVNVGKYTGIESEEEQMTSPEDFPISQNYPNPFNSATTIEFALPKSAFVTLKIYNLLGKEVATLISEQRTAGIHKINWGAKGVASGVYLYRLEVGDFAQVKKLILMR